MKKLLILSSKKRAFFCILTLLLGVLVFVSIYYYEKKVFADEKASSDSFQTYFEPADPPQGSVEEFYKDIFISLLLPYIDKAVDDFYGQGFTVDPWSVKVINMDRPNGYRTFLYVLKLEVMPYTLAHISVGLDHITISVTGSGRVKVEKFEHIKSYELPIRRQFLPDQ